MNNKKIAYLASRETLPGSFERRGDAHEHDLTVAALEPAFKKRGMEVCPVSWDDPDVSWNMFAAAVVGTTWDYWNRNEEFLATLDQIASQTTLFNSPQLIRWNSRKTYLRDLEKKGIPIIPTLWFDEPDRIDVEAAFNDFDSETIVLKRQVAAGAEGQYRLKKFEPVPAVNHPMMIQPFLSAILSEGEFSFVFIGDSFSHALVKTPVSGDYRIQSIYGGAEQAVIPSEEELRSATAVVEAVESDLLYARVDMIRADNGELLLMELEIIEPFLYPQQAPEFGERMAEALWQRSGRSQVVD